MVYYVKLYKKRLALILAISILLLLICYIWTLLVLPGNITLFQGEEYVYNLKSPFYVTINADRKGFISLKDRDVKASSYFNLSSPLNFKTQEKGSVNLNLKFFGIIPLRTMKVDILANKKVIACGNTIGVKLRVDGILVIGVSDVETTQGRKILPTKESGIKPGDLIVEVNNKKVKHIQELIDEIDKSEGNDLKIRYKRADFYNEASIKPVKSIDDNNYHIGLWVRDSTAGIGTLTFYDPATNQFGALGHGITDIDTGALMPIEKGEILESNIIGIKKGLKGSPGELKGLFIENGTLGKIDTNTECGIYGQMDKSAINRMSDRLYPIGLRKDVREGPATIFTNIKGKEVEEYNIEILKVSRSNVNGPKGMIIKITDDRLLNNTGGIVQGMSGSPIIQNDKIIGAVTHVLVNDPTRGYGIFIESMIKNMGEDTTMNLKKAG